MPRPKSDARTDEQRAAHNERMKRYFAAHPEQRQKSINRIKAKYHGDPEYRARVLANAKAWRERNRVGATVSAGSNLDGGDKKDLSHEISSPSAEHH